jgi:hypothetical protein
MTKAIQSGWPIVNKKKVTPVVCDAAMNNCFVCIGHPCYLCMQTENSNCAAAYVGQAVCVSKWCCQPCTPLTGCGCGLNAADLLLSHLTQPTSARVIIQAELITNLRVAVNVKHAAR